MNKELLLKLSAHLKQGKLAYRWDYTTYRQRLFNGVCGCAIGELAAMLAKDSAGATCPLESAIETAVNHSANFEQLRVSQEAKDLLGLQTVEYDYLFMPAFTVSDLEDGPILSATATAGEVGDLIEDFVKSDGVRRSRPEADFHVLPEKWLNKLDHLSG